jgi:hypothetical protein
MGTGSSLGIKRPGCGADYPPHLQPRLKKVYSYNSTPSLAIVACYRRFQIITLRTFSYCTSSKSYTSLQLMLDTTGNLGITKHWGRDRATILARSKAISITYIFWVCYQ